MEIDPDIKTLDILFIKLTTKLVARKVFAYFSLSLSLLASDIIVSVFSSYDFIKRSSKPRHIKCNVNDTKDPHQNTIGLEFTSSPLPN
jgi:hypothetical protein